MSISENLKWVTDAKFIGRTLFYSPSPNFKKFIVEKFAGQFSKNRRIRKKQVRKLMNKMLEKALDNMVRGIRERNEDKA
jgi:hypothetical protein